MDVPFPLFQAEVLALYVPPCRRASTYRKMRQVLGEFAAACPMTSDLTPAAVAGWIAGHGDRAAATHRSLLGHLQAACSYAVFRHYLAASPFGFRGPNDWLPPDELDAGEPFRRHRTAPEIASVLALADVEAYDGPWTAVRLRALVYLLAFTGCGKTEALGLRLADVDLPGRILRIASHARRRLKTRARAAPLPVPELLARVLEAWIPRCGCEWLFPGVARLGPWGGGPRGCQPLDRVKQLGMRAGVPGLTILSFRHSFATLSEDWGIGELMLQRILRHSNPQTQRHYRHEDLEQLRRAGGKIHFDSGEE